jgi:hypothetical protein
VWGWGGLRRLGERVWGEKGAKKVDSRIRWFYLNTDYIKLGSVDVAL